MPPGRFPGSLFGGGSASSVSRKAALVRMTVGSATAFRIQATQSCFCRPVVRTRSTLSAMARAPDGASLVRREDATLQRHDRSAFRTGLTSPGRAAPMLVAIRRSFLTRWTWTFRTQPHPYRGGVSSIQDTITVVTDYLKWGVEDFCVSHGSNAAMQLRGSRAGGDGSACTTRTHHITVRVIRVRPGDRRTTAPIPDDRIRRAYAGGARILHANRPPMIHLKALIRWPYAGLSSCTSTLPSAVGPRRAIPVVYFGARGGNLHGCSWTETRSEGYAWSMPDSWPVAVITADGPKRHDRTVVHHPDVVSSRLSHRQAARTALPTLAVTWRMFQWILSEGIQTQVDGGPVLDAYGRISRMAPAGAETRAHV